MSIQKRPPKMNVGKSQIPSKNNRKGRVRPRGKWTDQKSLQEVQNLIGKPPYKRQHLIDYLHMIQDKYGCLSHQHLVALAYKMNISQAQVHEVASFYSQFIIVPKGEKAKSVILRVCDSLACSMQNAEELLQECKKHFTGDVDVVKAPCMGRCDCAPVVSVNKRHINHANVDKIRNTIKENDFAPEIPEHKNFDAYIAEGGYKLLKACLNGEHEREEIIKLLSDSSLRGLGGAGYPTGRKWSSVLKLPKPKMIAVNFDESEMGTYKDRFFIESDPHRLLEGTLVAAWTCETQEGYIYLRDEYHHLHEILKNEISALDKAGLTKHCPLFLSRGAGAYICGERSAMLESIEGKRGYPRLKDPRTTVVGLFGLPTLINNAETLFWVRDIIEKGAKWFSGQGTNGRPCPRAFSVSGRVKDPGVKLTSAGITMQQLLEEYCGGMEDGHSFKGYCLGGSTGGILPASMANIPLDFDTMEEYGCSIGSAAITVFSDKDNVCDIVKNLMLFFEDESCGQCTPCRIGTEKAVKLLNQDVWDENLLNDLSEVMESASICGLGQAAPAPIRTTLKYFRNELNLK